MGTSVLDVPCGPHAADAQSAVSQKANRTRTRAGPSVGRAMKGLLRSAACGHSPTVPQDGKASTHPGRSPGGLGTASWPGSAQRLRRVTLKDVEEGLA